MDKKYILEKCLATITSAWIGNKLHVIYPALVFLSILMLLDYISGMLASKKEALEYPEILELGWSSKKSVMGIYKKVGYILTILVAISADYLIVMLISKIGITYENNTMFGLMVIIWFVLNELISILENAGRMGAVMPKFLKEVLTELKKNMEKKDK